MNISLKPLVVSFLLLTCMKSNAAITPFSEDYEGLAVASYTNDYGLSSWYNSELTNLGWETSTNVFSGIPLTDGSDGRGFWVYWYGFDAAPNTATAPSYSQILNVETDNSGGATNYLNVLSDYNNMTHSTPPTSVNALLLKEFVIDSIEIGKIITFTFDAKRPNFISNNFDNDESNAVGNGCSFTCTAGAFLKTIDPSNNYSQTNYITLDTSSISQSSWETFSISLDLADPLLDGQLLQVGFENFATNFDNTGVYYDNVSLRVNEVPIPSAAWLLASSLVSLRLARRK